MSHAGDPHALIVERFHPHARATVEEALARDPSGRTARATEACPGVFVLCAELSPNDRDEVLARISSGGRLRDVLRGLHLPRRPPHARSLVRRAPASLSPSVLYDLLHRRELVIHDRPRDPVASEAWYHWCGLALRRALHVLGFVSRRAGELEAEVRRRGVSRAELLAEIVPEVTRCAPPWPDRTHKVAPILDDARTTAIVLAWEDDALRFDPRLDLPLPAAPIASAVHTPVAASPLLSLRSMLVASQGLSGVINGTRAVEQGRSFWFRAVVGDTSAVVQVRRRAPDRYVLEYAAAHTLLEATHMVALRRWAETLRDPVMGDPGADLESDRASAQSAPDIPEGRR